MRRIAFFAAPLLTFLVPALASAHEVYVLSPEQIAYALHIQPFDMLAVALDNLGQFLFWTCIVFGVITTIFFASLFHRLEQLLDPLFDRAKKYAPLICRVTVGLGTLAGAYYQAAYGPELPLASAWGTFTPYITALMIAIGICLVFGIWVRLAGLAALILFGFAVWRNGIYMFTYANYFGEFFVLALLGTYTIGKRATGKFPLAPLAQALAPYEFLIIRVCFGISLLYASLYAKILHNNLALMVATLPLAGHPHGLAYYFGLEPHFLVLGAAIIEIVLASFFIFGIEIRWSCIFLEFWLSLSLWWFGESVWPHLILIGIPIALFFWGYDQYSLEWHFVKKHRALAPIL